MKDYDEQRQDQLRAKLKEMADDENHLSKLVRVFGSDDGLYVFEWLLDICGYWRSSLIDERVIAKFELGRYLFNQLCLADIDLCHTILDNQRKDSERLKAGEKTHIEGELR